MGDKSFTTATLEGNRGIESCDAQNRAAKGELG